MQRTSPKVTKPRRGAASDRPTRTAPSGAGSAISAVATARSHGARRAPAAAIETALAEAPGRDPAVYEDLFHELGNIFHRIYYAIERLEADEGSSSETPGAEAPPATLDRERQQAIADLRPEVDRLHQSVGEGLEFLRVPTLMPILLSVADIVQSVRGLIASATRGHAGVGVEPGGPTGGGVDPAAIDAVLARVGSRRVSVDVTQFQTGLRLILAQLVGGGSAAQPGVGDVGTSAASRPSIDLDVSCARADEVRIVLRSSGPSRADRAPAAVHLQWALAEHHLRATGVELVRGFDDASFASQATAGGGTRRFPKECQLRLTLAPDPGVG